MFDDGDLEGYVSFIPFYRIKFRYIRSGDVEHYPDLTQLKLPIIKIGTVGVRVFLSIEDDYVTEGKEGTVELLLDQILDFSTEKQNISTVSGLWYDPALNGMGFNILSASNGTMVYYYGYTKSGQRLWLHSDSQNTPWIQGTAKTITLYQSTDGNGANFNKPPTQGSGVSAWGILKLQFDSCTTGKATLVGKDGTQAFALTRLAGDKGLVCTVN